MNEMTSNEMLKSCANLDDGKESPIASSGSTLPTADWRSASRMILENLPPSSDAKNDLYHPLHSGDVIRFLELHPGIFDDALVCRFHYATLQDLHVNYEALSYVWGEGPSRRSSDSIMCNNQHKPIGHNLAKALRLIRSPLQPLLLWVDAICINQDDFQERGHQVTLMASIYRNARRVIIYIDEHDEEEIRNVNKSIAWDERTDDTDMALIWHQVDDIRVQRAFKAICEVVNSWMGTKPEGSEASYKVRRPDMGNDPSFQSSNKRSTSFDSSEGQELAETILRYIHRDLWKSRKRSPEIPFFEDDEEDGNALEKNVSANIRMHGIRAAAPKYQTWLSIADLFRRSWFWRLWVIQEAVLARDAIVKWGNAEIKWRWVGLAAAILRYNFNGICDDMRIAGVYNAYLIFRLSHLSDLPPLQLSFHQLLRLTRQFEVTDVRDRVYGLLGLKANGNDPDTGSLFLEPDYAINTEEVLARAARRVIESSQSLSILSSVQYSVHPDDPFRSIQRYDQDLFQSRESSGRPWLPSWAPTWPSAGPSTLDAWDMDESFEASKNFPLRMKKDFKSSSCILNVEGIQIGHVGFVVGHAYPDLYTSLLNSIHFGSSFRTEAGLRLISRVCTAGRDFHGSLTDPSEDTALHDFAAHSLQSIDPRDNFRAPNINARDSQLSSRIVPPNDHELELLRARLSLLARTGDSKRFRHTADVPCEGRTLFLTLNGFLGIAPDVIEGDFLVVLSGADVPFLLRPIANLNSLTEEEDPIDDVWSKRYVVVGECYVEGLMHGEAVQALSQIDPLNGPVPVDAIFREIMLHRNQKSHEFSRGPHVDAAVHGKDGKEGPAYDVKALDKGIEIDLSIADFEIW